MAGDPYWNNVVLAMHMDDVGLSDLKGHAVTLNGNAARSSVQSKFGGYSAYFDGVAASSVATTASTDTVLNGDFTIELWAKADTACPSGYMVSNKTSFTIDAWVFEPTHAVRQ